MAASDIITHDRIAEEGLIKNHLQKEFEDLLKVLPEVESAIKSLAKSVTSEFKNIKIAEGFNLDDLKQFNDLTKKANDLALTSARVQKIKADQLIAERKAEKELLDIQVKVNKENERQLALAEKTAKAQKKAADDTANVTKQLRELQKQLIGMRREDDPAKFDALAKKAGALKDQINDAKDAVKVFAKDSKAATAKTLFGQIAGDLKDLDFAGAADKAKQFSAVMRSITFSEVIGGLKNFGVAMLDVGKAIVLNPFLMLASAVVAVGLAIKETYESFQQADKINAKYNESLKEVDKTTRDMVKHTKELLIEQKLLRGEINKFEADRLKKGETFKDKYVQIKAEEFSMLSSLEKDYAEANKMTNTEMLTFNAGGQTLYAKRRALNAIKQAQEEMDIQKKFNAQLIELQKQYGAESTNAYIEESNNKKERDEKDRKEAADKLKKRRAEILKSGVLAEEIDIRDKIKQLEIDNIRDSKLREEAQATFNANMAIKELEQTKYNEEQKAAAIIEINRKLQNELDAIKLKHKPKGVLDESGVAEKAERDKKHKEDLKKLKEQADALADATEAALKRRDELINKQLDNELDARQRNIMQQQQLAEEGQNNIWAFEKAAADKAELAKQQQAIQEKRDAKNIAFFKMLASAATSENPAEALATSISTMGLGELYAARLIEGTEKVSEDPQFTGKKVHSGEDGYLAYFDGQERILNPRQNALIGDMSNDYLANLAHKHQMGMLPEYRHTGGFGDLGSSIVLNQIAELKDEVRDFKKIIKDRPVPSMNIDKNGIVSKQEFKNGLTRVVTYKPSNDRMI